jgi:hypothetical protein
MNREYALSLQSENFRMIKYRSVHYVHNLIWNRMKFLLKAAFYPAKLIDGKEMYDRKAYRALSRPLAHLLDAIDGRFARKTGANILAVYEKGP